MNDLNDFPICTATGILWTLIPDICIQDKNYEITTLNPSYCDKSNYKGISIKKGDIEVIVHYKGTWRCLVVDTNLKETIISKEIDTDIDKLRIITPVIINKYLMSIFSD